MKTVPLAPISRRDNLHAYKKGVGGRNRAVPGFLFQQYPTHRKRPRFHIREASMARKEYKEVIELVLEDLDDIAELVTLAEIGLVQKIYDGIYDDRVTGHRKEGST